MSSPEWIIFAAITIILISAFVSLRVFARKRKAVRSARDILLPNALPPEGVEIPLIAAYSGLKALAPVTFSQNNIYPRLILFEDHFDYKVILKKSAYYGDIEGLYSFRSRYYNKLRFHLYNSSLFFTAVLPDERMLEAVLSFLAAKGVHPQPGNRN